MLEESLRVQKSYPVKNCAPEKENHFNFRGQFAILDEVIMALLSQLFPPMHFGTSK